MKKLILFSLFVFVFLSCKTSFHLGQCNKLYFNLNKGTLNGVKGTASINEIKEAFPCFTGESTEGKMVNCGGGVFFLKHDFYFYSFKDYIEIRSGFKGKLSEDILNKSLTNLHDVMGKPTAIIEEYGNGNILNIGINYYQKPWGTIAFKEDDFTITQVQLYYGKTIEEIDFCN